MGELRKLFAAALMASAPFVMGAGAGDPPLSPNEIVAAVPDKDWVAIADSDILVMSLAPDRDGNPRTVYIQLMPPPFSQGWVDNIRTLARAKWYDGTAIVRVQDNYVVQWGDPNTADEGKAKPLPPGLKVMDAGDYEVSDTAKDKDVIVLYHPKPDLIDNYGDSATFTNNGWPMALEISDDTRTITSWPVHCYGMVGVGRDMPPDTGSGAELYTVIGHAPRHLDRNIALVGRIIEGIEHLSALPRGKGELGSYTEEQDKPAITSIRLMSEMPPSEHVPFQYLNSKSNAFGNYVTARANRRDPFFITPALGADICNIPVPIRRAKK